MEATRRPVTHFFPSRHDIMYITSSTFHLLNLSMILIYLIKIFQIFNIYIFKKKPTVVRFKRI